MLGKAFLHEQICKTWKNFSCRYQLRSVYKTLLFRQLIINGSKMKSTFPPYSFHFFLSRIQDPDSLCSTDRIGKALECCSRAQKKSWSKFGLFSWICSHIFSRLFGTGSALCEASCMRIWMEPNANPHHWNLMDYIQCCGVEIFFVRLSMRLHIWSFFWLHLQPYNFHLKLNYNSWTSLGGGRK